MNTPPPRSGTILAWYGPQNKYSWASIVATMEGADLFEGGVLELATVRENLVEYLAGLVDNAEPGMHYFVMFSVNSYHASKILKVIDHVDSFRKERNIDNVVHVLAGGPHVTARPSEMLAAGVDIAVTGEGEQALLAYFNQFIRKVQAREPFTNHGKDPGVPNCWFTAPPHGIVETTRAPPACLDDHPPVAAKSRLFRPIEISRGCPHGCRYCQTPALFGRVMRHRSTANVIHWVERAVALKYNKVWFTTPNAFAFGSNGTRPEPGTLEALLRGLHRIDGLEKIFFGTFPSEVRPEFVTRDVLDAIAPYIANDTFVVGAQSASPRILDKIHRGHTIEDVWNAVDVITGAGFKIDIDMIFGLPGETRDDVGLDIEFIKQVLAKQGTRIHGHVFMPLPGTPFEQERPGIIDKELASLLGRYALKQRVFGSHFHQQHRARRIHDAGKPRE